MATADPADYTINEHDSSYIRVRVRIPNLKPKKKSLMKKLTGGGRKDEAQNAQIDCNFDESCRSFTLIVTGDEVKEMKNKKWELTTSSLPHPIDRDSSYYQVEEGFVHVFLKKANADDDWSLTVRKGEL